MSIIGGTTSTGTSTDSTSQSAQSAASLQGDMNQFLNLLTTQLKNQDPLDPMNSNEFTTQLVQFASVEQQIYQNSNLEKLVTLQETNKLSGLVGFIGTRVEVQSNDVVLENGKADFTYTTPSGTATSKVTITDGSGNEVYTADGDNTTGVHSVSWDGTDTNGTQQPDGLYHVTVTNTDNKGNLLDTLQTSFGTVTGAGVVNGTTTIFLGPLRVPEDQVLSVERTSSTDTTSATDSSSTSTGTGTGTDTTNNTNTTTN